MGISYVAWVRLSRILKASFPITSLQKTPTFGTPRPLIPAGIAGVRRHPTNVLFRTMAPLVVGETPRRRLVPQSVPCGRPPKHRRRATGGRSLARVPPRKSGTRAKYIIVQMPGPGEVYLYLPCLTAASGHQGSVSTNWANWSIVKARSVVVLTCSRAHTARLAATAASSVGHSVTAM